MSEIVERVIAAYRKHDLRAVQENWGVEPRADGSSYDVGPTRCCCGMGALLIGCSALDEDRYMDQDTAIRRLLGVTQSYVDGFINGFDGKDPCDDETENHDYAVGFEEGRMTWIALVKAELIATIDHVVESNG